MTSFVGRADELRDLQRLLGAARLVTLVGTAGVGKSRLAIAWARKHRSTFRDGVWFVGLDCVSDPALVGHAVAAALRLAVPSTQDPEAILHAHLRSRRALLVIDNCEHLLEATSRLISSLLRAAPEIRVLATSRIPMRITGEFAWPVPPLSCCEGEDEEAVPALRHRPTEALALLAERASAVAPGFHIDDRNRQTAEALCRKLEGLPLAIELAATRLRIMSLDQLLHALDHRYDVLSVGAADAPQRHRSLRAAVEWSYELCSPQARELWLCLSVLPGSFDLEAAMSVCGEQAREQILASLEVLMDMSVLMSRHGEDDVRFRMLETIREFGRERAVQTGRLELLRARLCAHYLRLAEESATRNLGTGQAAWLSRMRDERPNVWAALEVALAEPEGSTNALRMCGALWFVWVSGATGEGRHWLDRALLQSTAPSVDRARALWTAGYVALTAGDLEQARGLLGECTQLARDLGEETLIAQAAQLLGVTNMFDDELPAAVELLEQSVSYYEAASIRHPASAIALGQLGVAYVLRGQASEGMELVAQCAEASVRSGDLWCRSWASWLHAVASWFAGELGAAKESAELALRAKRALNDRVGVAACLELNVWIAHRDGDLERSARLVGAACRLWHLTGGNRLFGFAALLRCAQELDGEARAAIGVARCESLADEGSHMSEGEAVDFALGLGAPRERRRPAPSMPLTPRELEVAQLVAQGMSNRQIAAALVVADRTAESHVEHIRTKLGLRSRSQVAAWVLGAQRVSP